MSSPCERRGETKISKVMTILQTLPLFCEYPLEQQKRISRYAQFDELEAGRIIVRQGHRAETFYWILSGIATVTVIESVDGTNTSTLKDVLNAGDSINESPVLTGSLRDHTVTCKDTVQILSINRKELVELISDNPTVEAPHIAYCRKLSLFEDFPLSVLYKNADKSAFHFFRRGAVIVKNSKENEWLYVIKSGSCQVLKRLRQVKAKLHQATKTHLLEEETLPDINRSNRLTAQNSKEPKSRKASTQISCQCCQQTKKSDLPPVFVQLDVLKPRDGFGFADLVFETTPSVSLVSNGAECVMISKKLFLQHMNSLCRQRVLREAKLYPTDATLQKKLQDQANWKEYKRVTLDTALKRVEERDRFVAH
ncbi:cyclic nucleotide-binding domain-containing protein 2-like [Oscarella lobularis]|uniref:cyclic nucleotide-binding domain-containing protein 2-like n=1 Tax=Oscarella lobularis TaxID=121494 RepID=UPI00331438A7